MKAFLLRVEPLIWLLFGQGILIGTILLTGWILVVGLLLPLGLVSPEALSYERAHMLGSSLIGRLVLAALRWPPPPSCAAISETSRSPIE
jgi:fumarate reductase subunit D